MPGANPDVDAIIDATRDGRDLILAQLRRIIHAGDAGIAEVVKWRKPSNPLGVAVFERNGIVCILIPLKGRVRMSFAEGASLPDPKNLFNAQLNGKSRAIDFPLGARIDVSGVKSLVRAAVVRRGNSNPHAMRIRKPRAK